MEAMAIFPANAYSENCPTRLMLDRIADKWTVLILGRLAGGKQRFGMLRRDVEGISPKVLTQKLRDLERDGLVTRRVFASVPLRVEYALTPLGGTLVDLVDAIRIWSETNIGSVLDAQQRFDARPVEEEV